MKPAAAQMIEALRPTLAALKILAGAEAAKAARAGLKAHAEDVVTVLEGKAGKKATTTADAAIAAIYGTDEPEPAWWGTDLGQLVAAHASDTGITLTHASQILGVRPQTVSVLIKREALAPIVPEQGPRLVSRASVLERKRTMSTDTRSRIWAAKPRD